MCGIAPSKQADIFHSYRRTREFSDTKAGLGLGLSLVSHIARLHGGSVMLENRKSGGTLVTLMIPTGLDKVTSLHSPVPERWDSGPSLILTELSDVLDADCFQHIYPE